MTLDFDTIKMYICIILYSYMMGVYVYVFDKYRPQYEDVGS